MSFFRLSSRVLRFMSAVLFFCVAFVSVANAAGTESATTEIPWWGKILIAIGSSFGAALSLLLGGLVKRLFDYVAQLTKLAFLQEVGMFVGGYVTELANGAVKKAKAAAKDGKLSQKEKDEFKQLPIEAAKEYFGSKKFTKFLGSASDVVVKSLLGPQVESAVTADKKSKAIIKAAASPLSQASP